MIPYNVEKVRELEQKIEDFMEKECKGKYTFPEIIVAFHCAVTTRAYFKVQSSGQKVRE